MSNKLSKTMILAAAASTVLVAGGVVFAPAAHADVCDGLASPEVYRACEATLGSACNRPYSDAATCAGFQQRLLDQQAQQRAQKDKEDCEAANGKGSPGCQ
jgi:hypothetical protein